MQIKHVSTTSGSEPAESASDPQLGSVAHWQPQGLKRLRRLPTLSRLAALPVRLPPARPATSARSGGTFADQQQPNFKLKTRAMQVSVPVDPGRLLRRRVHGLARGGARACQCLSCVPQRRAALLHCGPGCSPGPEAQARALPTCRGPGLIWPMRMHFPREKNAGQVLTVILTDLRRTFVFATALRGTEEHRPRGPAPAWGARACKRRWCWRRERSPRWG